MTVLEKIHSGLVYIDGAMGSLLQKGFLNPGEFAESLNITNPDIIKDIHKKYIDSGADIILTNTFGANLFHFSKEAEPFLSIPFYQMN